MRKVEVDYLKESMKYKISHDENPRWIMHDIVSLCTEIELWHGIARDLYEKDICDVCDECWDDCECPCHDEKYEARNRASSFLRGWEIDE